MYIYRHFMHVYITIFSVFLKHTRKDKAFSLLKLFREKYSVFFIKN